MWQIICVGDLCCDLIVPYGNMQQALRLGDISKETTDRLQVSMQCGGSVGNVARHLGALGDNPIFVTPLKMDSLGSYLFEKMQEAGVDMRWVSDSESSNMYCVAVLDESGERTMFCFIPPWADYPRFNDKSFLRVEEGARQMQAGTAPILFTSGMAFLDDADNNRSVLVFFKTEKDKGATIVFDLNVRAESYGYEGIRKTDMEEMIAMSDIVLGSGADEFRQVTGCADIPHAAAILLGRMQDGIVVARDGGEPILVAAREGGNSTIGLSRNKREDTIGDQAVNKNTGFNNIARIAAGESEEPGSVRAAGESEESGSVSEAGKARMNIISDERRNQNTALGIDDISAAIVTPLPVTPVSTLGAGDSFDAKLLSELARGEDILNAVKSASDYAGEYISTRH